jgi:acetoacetyl-CoA reductase/3-oxoacyl-[acyl-carrier protein] reductase
MGSSSRVALVTGAARGIGRGIALALAAEGMAVAVGYHSAAALAAEAAEEIRATGGRALPVEVRVEDRAGVRAALAAVRDAFGPVDILVNNAAMAQEKPFLTLTDEDWSRMMAVNLQGPFICAQEALPDMLEKGWGRIVNIVSIGGQWGGLNQVHYAAAKAGLINFTRSLAKLYGGRGITANAVSPGLVATRMTAAELDSEAGRQKVAQIPAGRIGTVDEVAAAVVFLASERASYVLGQTLNVNGGQYFG